MSKSTLYPSIESIHQRLFGLPDDYLLALAADSPDIPDSIRSAAMQDADVMERVMTLRASLAQQENIELDVDNLPQPPTFIQTLIEQQVATRLALTDLKPTPGLIMQLDLLSTPDGKTTDLLFASPFNLLLDRQAENECWFGWLVAPDIQYASHWDCLLQEEDQPFDPVCGMIQIWNPLQVYLPANVTPTVLGRLSVERLQAVRALAVEYVMGCTEKPRPKPGHIALRATFDGHSVVTGTPLGDNTDPRHAYQYEYHHAAQVLNQPLRAWQANPFKSQNNWFSDLVERLVTAWKASTGDWVDVGQQVAYAMSDQPNSTHKVLDLTTDLRLELIRREAGLGVIISYQGEVPVKVRFLQDAETVEAATLTADSPAMEYQIFDITEAHWLQIDLGAAGKIELPLSLE